MSNQFNDDNLAITVTRSPNCRIKMEVTIAPAASKKAWEQAINNVKKEVSIPGFRKGKAPNAFVEKNFKNQIENEWQNTLLQNSVSEALNLSKIYPYANNKIDKANVDKSSLTDSSHLTIEFEGYPEIPNINIEELSIKPEEPKAFTEKEVNAEFELIRLNLAETENVTDRPAQEGDYVNVDIESLEAPGQFICENTRFAIREGLMQDWMRQQLIGMQVNESKEGHVENNEIENSKPFPCTIKLNSIQTPILPEINDDLAKKVGAENLEDLTSKIKQKLTNIAVNDAKDLMRKQIHDQIIEKFPFDVPGSIVKKLSAARQKELLNQTNRQKLNQEEIQEIENQAIKDFRIHFILGQYSRDNQITVDESAVMQETISRYMQNNAEMGASQDQSSVQEQLMALKNQVSTELHELKTIDSIIDLATKKA